MPTTATNTWSQKKLEPQLGSQPVTVPCRFKASSTIALGTLLGKVTATGRMAAYNDGLSDGTQTCVGICPYTIVTDASGNITNLGDQGSLQASAEMYISGIFVNGDLTGVDAAALTDLGGKYIGGDSSATGFLRIP